MNPLSIHDGSRTGDRHRWRGYNRTTLARRQQEAEAAQKRREHFAALNAAEVNQQPKGTK